MLCRKYAVPLVLALAAVLVLLFSSCENASPNESSEKSEIIAEILDETLEEKIKNICERVDGVGNVYVMLTLDTSEEYVYASDTEKNDSFIKSEFVTSDGDGVELYVVFPKVRGVAVVCNGGDSAVIRKTLTDLISCALGIPASNISVAGS